MRRCDPWSVCYKTDSQAWGYRMRLLSSIFPNIALATKMPLRFNNLDIGGGFPLLQNAPSFSTTASYKDIPFHFQGLHIQRNIFATKCNVGFNNIHQDPWSSSIIVHRSLFITDQYRSCIIMPPLFFKTKIWTILCCYKMPVWFDKPAWSSSCHATKCNCDFHDGLTW